MANRPKIPVAVEMEVLISCRRRCCLCYFLNNDLDVKKGQIAHLDDDRTNNKVDNLAFLCFDHHDQYDSETRQSKNFTITEVKAYRQMLFDKIAADGVGATVPTVPAEERQRQIERQRAEFEARVVANDFYSFKAEAAVMAVSIFPAVVPVEPVEPDNCHDVRMWRIVQPIGSSGANQFTETQTEPDAVVCPKDMDIVPTALTALKVDGSILAVRNLNGGQDSFWDIGKLMGQSRRVDISKPYAKPMSMYQPDLVAAVRRYLNGLKEVGVDGPWHFGLSIQKAMNLWLVGSNDHFDRSGRPCCHDTMRAETIRIEAHADLSSDDAVFGIIKRPLKAIWKFCGRSEVPKYTSDGRWTWVA